MRERGKGNYDVRKKGRTKTRKKKEARNGRQRK
jgi:hypothetical protein